ncbi:hypothetical protein CDD83_8029 [Cordyceps sp. RAO-2017]|nr:hypothetical protein CDD83_8029 [Cordyceps sp. RAO-2017]
MISFSTKSHKSKKDKDKDKAKDKSKKDRKSRKSKNTSEPKDADKSQHAGLGVYCAIYQPHSGNYYHWALAVVHAKSGQWHTFEVVQDQQDGPYRAQCRQTNPLDSRRCLQPLIILCALDENWWGTLMAAIGSIPVPGEGLYWNCQDYTLDIWQSMLEQGMIDHETWYKGREDMMSYYGQDFGGQDADDSEDEVEDDEEGVTQAGQERRRILSEEYVYDSDE